MALLPGSRPLIAYTVHGFPYQWDRQTVHSAWLMPGEWLLSFASDLLLFQSQEDFVQAKRKHFHGTLTYIGNGVGDEWFVGPRATSCEDFDNRRPIRAVFVGRLTKEKGVLDLLAAIGHTTGVELTVVGDELPSDRDPVATQAHRMVESAKLPVTFRGHLDPSAVRATLLDADLFILPSWREGVPRSVIEAMACGLPVIATDIRGCRELVTENVTGWLVPPKDPLALAQAINRVAQLNPRRLVDVGAAGFEIVADGYREAQVFARLQHAYGQLGMCP